MKSPLLISILLLSSITINAQWVDDTSINNPICVANNYQVDLRMMEDGLGGFFLVWKDYRNGTPDIFAQRVNALGEKLWATDGVPVCSNSSDQSTPGLISDGADGIIVSWSDWRSGIERDIYAQRLNGDGQPLWIWDGVVVVNKTTREHNQRMVMDGQGGAIVVFEQKNSATYNWELWAQRIDANGNGVWNPGGIPVTTILSEHLNERIQSDGQGGVYIAFQDFRNGIDYDVYVQHLGPNGEYLWGTGVLACNATGTQTNPKIDPDPNGGVVVAWTDKRNMVDYDIYAQRIDFNGNLLWGAGGKAVCSVPGNQSAVDLLSNEVVNGVILTWKDERTGVDYDIYCNRLDWEGNQTWTMNGMPVCVNAGDQINPNITGDGYGGAAIVWQDQTTGNFDIRMQRIYAEGYIQYPISGKIISDAISDQSSPKSCSTELGVAVFAWEDNRTGLADVYCAKVQFGGPWVNVDETALRQSNAYPNPFLESIRFSALGNDWKEISIFSTLGQLQFREQTTREQMEIDAGDWNPGCYWVQIKQHHGMEVFQIMKQ